MKKTLLFTVIAMLFMTACQQSPEPVTVDLEAEKAAATEVVNAFIEAMTFQHVDILDSLLAEDALLIGTDPTEFISKEETMDIWQELSEGPEIDFLFMDETKIKMASDGNSAIAISQYYVPMMLPNVPLRNVMYLTKENGNWMVSLQSMAIIPKNEDLPKIVEVLGAEE